MLKNINKFMTNNKVVYTQIAINLRAVRTKKQSPNKIDGEISTKRT